MLRLQNIVKNYKAGDSEVQALKGVSMNFRKSEFVSVLGPSGCGKTTLLNIIGGLDQYTSGDLIINGRSTKNYKDKDWDSYRNHSIGFVFQSYNLIPHQSVLSNVELALTLSGVSKSERRRRAKEALEKVGLGDQLGKKPNQMSGGQMQRVAIARALVNDPDILLADEPTGALDTETSVQVMEILKDVASDRLVIMVTHNPDLANEYSTRIIRLLDGRVVDDSNPYDGEDAAADNKHTGKTGMSFFTATALSLNNLMTKKGRTFLTAFAGSIGIIGIALILSLSTGVNNYINRVQEDTLSSYPITIESETMDLSSLISAAGVSTDSDSGEGLTHELDKVYTSHIMYDLFNSMTSVETKKNNLVEFKKFLDVETNSETATTGLSDYVSSVQYSYDLNLNVYTKDTNDEISKVDAQAVLKKGMESVYGMNNTALSYFTSMSSSSSYDIWQQLLPGTDGELISELVQEQYDMVAGHWPEEYNEVVLVMDENNEVSDLVLYALGLKDSDDMVATMDAVMNGEEIDTSTLESWTYDEIMDKEYRLVLSADHYQQGADGTYINIADTDLGLQSLYNNGTEIKICGIVRQSENAVSGMLTGSLCYTTKLMDYIVEKTAENELIKAQLSDPETDAILGIPFKTDEEEEIPASEKAEKVREYFKTIDSTEKAEIYTDYKSVPEDGYVDSAVQQQLAALTREDIEAMISEQYPEYASMVSGMDDETLYGYVAQSMAEQITAQYAEGVKAQMSTMTVAQLEQAFDMTEFTEEELAGFYDVYLPQQYSDSSYDENMKLLGYVDYDSPTSINIYASTFEAKDGIADIIADYNASAAEEDQINYTDYVKLLMSSITTIINAISYVLIAFVAISLVVSSIMIGIITYISVLERTKEIGILRAIGASKRDISRVFNAETLIVGFCSGAIGIGFTLLVLIPANAIIHRVTDIPNLSAQLPAVGGALLVAISMFLTFIAGLIPSKLAAKKDPVVALRSE